MLKLLQKLPTAHIKDLNWFIYLFMEAQNWYGLNVFPQFSHDNVYLSE